MMFRVLALCVGALAFTSAATNDKYIMGKVGKSCTEVCYDAGMNCNPAIGNNSLALMKGLGVNCTANPTAWWATNQPGFVSGSPDPNHGECLGFNQVPSGVLCAGSYPTVSRLCRCDEPNTDIMTFGTGVSAGSFGSEESHIFSWVLAKGDMGVMRHFWITYTTAADPSTIIRYYIDGETEPSIEFMPSLAAGVGFYDNSAPWGNEFIGKGAKDGAWNINIPVPFYSSIRITTQHLNGNVGYYVIVRGEVNIPVNIGGQLVPPGGRLQQLRTNRTAQPLEYIRLADIPSGHQGFAFLMSLQFSSKNLNTLEGCFHMYTADQEFPGTILSTGTEDYFDSAWYFNAGEFHLPISGFTHLNQSNGITWSGYRLHHRDPLRFSNGFAFDWRNGDAVDASGIKCMIADGSGRTVGSPSVIDVMGYVWVYTWPSST